MIALTPVEPYSIEPEEDARLRRVAETLAVADDRFGADPETYKDQLAEETPDESVLTLHVDDFSIISNVQGLAAIDRYPGRAFVRARQGDLVAGTFPPIPGYDDYLAERLGLGRPSYVQARPAPGALPYAGFEALLADEAAQRQIEAHIAANDRALWIHPYMGLEAAWRFARLLADRCRQRVHVLAPLPRITEQANNKAWFTDVVRLVLGEQSALRAQAATSAEKITGLLRLLSSDRPGRVAVKLSDSASGMGTELIETEEILERAATCDSSDESLRAFVDDWLATNGWQPGSPPVTVEPWEDNILGSPSIQLWIPPAMTGGATTFAVGNPAASTTASSAGPILEGVFDQLFYPDDETVFLGSIPSRLPAPIRAKIGRAGGRLGRVFQYLGYVGRCSFDTILVGADLTTANIVFTECNGRWGGTSTPMSLMNRLFGDYRKQSYHCSQLKSDRLVGVPLCEFARALDDVLFDKPSGAGWAIIFNVGCLEPAGKLDLITLGETFEEAESRQARFQEIIRTRF